jgi:hypothetical protein
MARSTTRCASPGPSSSCEARPRAPDNPVAGVEGLVVHTRGQFGCKAGAASRPLYPIVLGLGGRWLGALITTLVGAAAGGDLLLLTFDISRDRQVGDQSALMT